jgi:DNA-binding transcriptional ArsR family regulator
MQDESNRPDPIGPLLERALSHPKRVEILDYLTRKEDGRGARRTELARILGLSAANVKYHLRVLDDAGLIARVESRGQGRAEHPYKAPASAGP